MVADPCHLHVAFFPFMTAGHTIPILDIISLFATHHVRTTVITTTLNAPNITKLLDGTNTRIEIFSFPGKDVGLPEGIEDTVDLITPEMVIKFINVVQLLQDPLEKFLEKSRPHCLIADMFFPFATDVAAKFGIPRLVFHGTSFFSLCAWHILLENKPDELVSSDDELFILPNLPHEIKFTRLQLSPDTRHDKQRNMVTKALEYDRESYGVIVNSFFDLEPDYADYYKKVLGKKAWNIGPVSLCNRNFEHKSQRGQVASIDAHECLKWLDSKEPYSGIYVCFGSSTRFSAIQLHEIAMALEASSQQFIWVVKKGKDEEQGSENWFPDGFEKRMEGKGLIIRGWAPQVLILDHQAIGGFVTHCGWNLILEGVSAGVPMVTWPVGAEQFLNEKVVTQVLKIGFPVGSKQWSMVVEGSLLKRGEIEAALSKIMVGEEALEMRSRAKKLKEMAWKAVEEGGSSHSDLSALIKELTSYLHSHHC